MGYNFKPLEEYFHKIVSSNNNMKPKELAMFDVLKAKWNELWTTRYEFDVPQHQPTKAYLEFKAEMEKAEEELSSELKEILKPEIVDCWAFEIQTSAYECDGEIVEAQHDIVTDSSDTTWMDTLDQILDVMGKHYGYNIKEQVYYSVTFPLNKVDERTGEPYAGYGRCLNDEVLQQLLLAFPELYESVPFGGGVKKGIFE